METKIAAILIALILASGCAMPQNGQNGENNDDGGETELASERGLRIEMFRTTDETLRPEQPALVKVRLKNYHKKDINITELSIYNEGLLSVSNKRCTPSIGNLGPASGNTAPEMICKWDLEAPPEDAYSDFSSKPASLNLHLEYESALRNHDPFKIEYKSLSDINNSRTVSETFSNSEASMTIRTEEPVPADSGRNLQVSAKEVGKGRLAANTGYDFSFSPSNLFKDCDKTKKPVVDKKVEFSCRLDGGMQGTRNLVFSTSYKYVKEPVLNIKLVNNQ